MQYTLNHYYQVNLALVCALRDFIKEPPKNDNEAYARTVIERTYFLILNKIDELDGTNERLLNITGRILKNIKGCDILKSRKAVEI